MDEALYNLSLITLEERLKRLPFADRVEDRIKAWLDEATAHTASLVDTHWARIERVAQQVLRDEIIDAPTLTQLMESN